ncbi:MAG: cytochrome [Massilia sp.]|jgi:cytochrome b561|nr:cytochrome [Massilia sp.]
MRLRDSPSAFGPVSRFNHWLGALLVLAMLALGLYFSSLPPGAERSYWRTLHIAIGTLSLPLVAFRIVWRCAASAPLAPPHPRIERVMARGVHLSMLMALVAMLTSGVLMQWFARRPIGVFDLLRIASPLTESDIWHERMAQLHAIAAWCLIGLIALHVVGALKHGLQEGRAFWGRMLGQPGKQ